MRLRIVFDELPLARWGALFHVLCLEHPAAVLEFTPVAFPTDASSRLEGADVGLFVNPPRRRPGGRGSAIRSSRPWSTSRPR